MSTPGPTPPREPKDVAAPQPDRLLAWASWIVARALRLLGATWRIREEGYNPLDDPSVAGEPHLGAVWHRGMVVASFAFRDRPITAPVSRSGDGDIVTATLVQLGFTPPPRGSSSRGGTVALRALVRLSKQGITTAVQCDGPRGPARRCKIGVVALSRLSEIPVRPIAISARPCLRFASWDGTLLPLPFARVVLAFGEPIHVPRDADPDTEEVLRVQVDHALNTLTDDLDRRLKLRPQRKKRGKR